MCYGFSGDCMCVGVTLTKMRRDFVEIALLHCGSPVGLLHICRASVQFGFRQHYSTSYVLLNLTEAIMKALDDVNFTCGIFVDLQKAFDTVDHSILLSKLYYYGIRGLANKWFESCLANRKQFVSINGFESSTSSITYGVPQGSVLGPLLFFIYINDLQVAIKHCKVHHSVDDTNLVTINKSLKRLNKLLNIDLKTLQIGLMQAKFL